MPSDFIEKRFNSSSLFKAQRQQKQLSYFTESETQKDITTQYLKQWANRNYKSSDYFLNFVKTVFKTDNFLQIFKYLRHPLPSARLINDKIKTPLGRVFFSEDSYFKYEVHGELINDPSELDSKNFDELVFNSLMFRHNDIMVVDLKDINTPFKSIVSIEDVISIDSENSIIKRIAYNAQINHEKTTRNGVLYIDSSRYSFYEKDKYGTIKDEPTLDIPHDLGRCPADYISSESFSESDIIRKSIFTYVREELEEYVFLKTIQRMVEPSVGIPTVTMLNAGVKNDNSDKRGEGDQEPMSLEKMQGQVSSEKKTVQGSKALIQGGTVLKIPLQGVRDADGNINMDIVKNYINFFYAPVEALEYLNKRILQVRQSIISNVVGDYSEGSTPEGSKSDSEINKVTIVSKQDKLRDLSKQISRIRTRSDYNWLALKFGQENVSNVGFYGSDFFLESQKELNELIKSSPNPIEQKSLLIKSNRNRNRFNIDNFTRDKILYQLIPYAVREDFNLAVDREKVSELNFQYQTRFNYWISSFEARYGDILTFWRQFDVSEHEKVELINNLVLTIIKDNYEKSSLA